MKYQESDYSKIKLIIWDLDETFWEGTFSEGDVVCPQEHIELLHLLTETGVVNSICSKNDDAPTRAKLTDIGAMEYFVFPSINWEAKGKRIKQIIEDMQLRPANVLFLDDNHLNIAEAEFYCPEIMTAGPEVIPALIKCAQTQFDSGKRKNRMQQYRILEQKCSEREDFGSNEEFLAASCIQVEISEDCADKAERICELNKRANQLNFTKNRVELDEIERVLNDPEYRCGTVAVSDRYGDYGITGFYCVDTRANRLLHFCFSCRTMGMGVEQYVYKYLNRPQLEIVGEISSDPNVPEDPFWINNSEAKEKKDSFEIDKKVLFKGPCDLWSVCNFFSDNSIATEFTYDTAKNGAIDYGLNHTNTMLNAALLPQEEIDELSKLPFAGEKTYSKALFSGEYQVILLSVLMDGMMARYRNKKTGRIVVWGDWCIDITNPGNWDKLIAKEIETYSLNFDREFLEEFSGEWEYLGQIPIDETVANFIKIRELLPEETVLILSLGSEIPYEKNTDPVYFEREKYNVELNRKLEAAFSDVPNTYLLNTTDLITSQNDFNDGITHFRKPVYYRMANEINRILNESGIGMNQRGKAYMVYASARQKLWQNETVRKVYYKLRGIK